MDQKDITDGTKSSETISAIVTFNKPVGKSGNTN